MKLTKNSSLPFNIGYLTVFSALIIGSLKPVLIKMGIADSFATPLTISIFSAIIAGFIVIIFNRPDLKYFKKIELYVPGFLLLLNTILTAFALKFTNLVTVITIISLTPIVVAFHKAILERSFKNLEWFMAGFAVAFMGVMQVIEINNFNDLKLNLLGILFASCAVMVSDVYRIFIERKSLKIEPENLSSMIIITGAVFGIIYLPFNVETVANHSLNFWILVILLAGSIVYSNLLFVKALKSIGALTTSLGYIMQPAVVVFLGVLLISETLKLNHLTGISLIILGLLIFKLPAINLKLKERGYLWSK